MFLAKYVDSFEVNEVLRQASLMLTLSEGEDRGCYPKIGSEAGRLH